MLQNPSNTTGFIRIQHHFKFVKFKMMLRMGRPTSFTSQWFQNDVAESFKYNRFYKDPTSFQIHGVRNEVDDGSSEFIYESVVWTMKPHRLSMIFHGGEVTSRWLFHEIGATFGATVPQLSRMLLWAMLFGLLRELAGEQSGKLFPESGARVHWIWSTSPSNRITLSRIQMNFSWNRTGSL